MRKKSRAKRTRVIRIKRRILKFTDILSNERSLTGLEEDGSVWVYLGENKGWKPLPMVAASGYEIAAGQVRGLEEPF
jgi:hypothetical protein